MYSCGLTCVVGCGVWSFYFSLFFFFLFLEIPLSSCAGYQSAKSPRFVRFEKEKTQLAFYSSDFHHHEYCPLFPPIPWRFYFYNKANQSLLPPLCTKTFVSVLSVFLNSKFNKHETHAKTTIYLCHWNLLLLFFLFLYISVRRNQALFFLFFAIRAKGGFERTITKREKSKTKNLLLFQTVLLFFKKNKKQKEVA